jgi:cytochrome bd-type quinol oxidase subunit 1
MLAMGLGLAAVLTPAQIVVGHLNGEYTAEHQPAKFTAIEGRWQTEQPARLLLLAWPDIAAERNPSSSASRTSAASSTRATSAPPSRASSRCPRTSGRRF